MIRHGFAVLSTFRFVPQLFFPSADRTFFTAQLDFGIKPPADPVGEIIVIGPRRDLEERWHFFLSGL